MSTTEIETKAKDAATAEFVRVSNLPESSAADCFDAANRDEAKFMEEHLPSTDDLESEEQYCECGWQCPLNDTCARCGRKNNFKPFMEPDPE